MYSIKKKNTNKITYYLVHKLKNSGTSIVVVLIN